MEDVMINEGEIGFQSKLVSGAVKSVDLEFESSASGVSFCVGVAYDREVIELLGDGAADAEGRDHNRRWSPDVASKSVNGLLLGGSHSTRVMG